MSTLRFVSLLLLICTAALAEPPALDIHMRETLSRAWKTVRFGVYLDGGDYASRRDTILLQRLDSERASLSIIRRGSAAGWRLPVLVSVVPATHAWNLIEKALDFYATAKGEEPPKKGFERNPPSRLDMFLDFVVTSSNDEYSYRVNFDLDAETHKKFAKFLEEAVKIPKN